MTLEQEFVGLLMAQCARVFPLVAPVGTARPYVTWQHIGGEPLLYVDNEHADARHALIQVDAWADDPQEAFALMQAIDEALRASPDITCVPTSEPRTEHVDEINRYGAAQDFDVWH